jgi:hypothetical protein
VTLLTVTQQHVTTKPLSIHMSVRDPSVAAETKHCLTAIPLTFRAGWLSGSAPSSYWEGAELTLATVTEIYRGSLQSIQEINSSKWYSDRDSNPKSSAQDCKPLLPEADRSVIWWHLATLVSATAVLDVRYRPSISHTRNPHCLLQEDVSAVITVLWVNFSP